jgi:hypothetical protein
MKQRGVNVVIWRALTTLGERRRANMQRVELRAANY